MTGIHTTCTISASSRSSLVDPVIFFTSPSRKIILLLIYYLRTLFI
ncbi:hypothetical protein CENSYa_1922 [Cenarchaeum symbiosum A]|uniref:Uncharacterized protein n=1 Tax=Cenarchaeum symbiosum (strain A) TaxID=414004 RepID=A0RYW4_CENSY|nr:hypothetical protein CENSYa_1922 [Cenarchaeum symbiosum A]